MSNETNNVVIVNTGKSVFASLLLTFFFGPLGMFYSTGIGAFIMIFLYILIGIPTLGLGLLALHPIAMIWGAVAVTSYNRNLCADVTVKTDKQFIEVPNQRNTNKPTECMSCASEVAEDDVVCSYCGTKLRAECPRCKAPHSIGKNFCSKCGEPLEKRENQLIKEHIQRNTSKLKPNKCASCGSDVSGDDLVCSYCGTRLRAECPICKTPYLIGKYFCSKCGEPLSKKEEQIREIPRQLIAYTYISNKCTKCGAPLLENMTNCSYCGKKREAECPSCKERYSVGKAFCGKCGSILISDLLANSKYLYDRSLFEASYEELKHCDELAQVFELQPKYKEWIVDCIIKIFDSSIVTGNKSNRYKVKLHYYYDLYDDIMLFINKQLFSIADSMFIKSNILKVLINNENVIGNKKRELYFIDELIALGDNTFIERKIELLELISSRSGKNKNIKIAIAAIAVIVLIILAVRIILEWA